MDRLIKGCGIPPIRQEKANGWGTRLLGVCWELKKESYSAARASVWVGKRPAYLVIPTMVKTLVKCAERPKA